MRAVPHKGRDECGGLRVWTLKLERLVFGQFRDRSLRVTKTNEVISMEERYYGRRALWIFFSLGLLVWCQSYALADGVDVRIWTDKSIYHVGEPFTMSFSVSENAAVTLHDLLPDGNTITRNLGEQDAGAYRLTGTVTEPLGLEVIQIVASTAGGDATAETRILVLAEDHDHTSIEISPGISIGEAIDLVVEGGVVSLAAGMYEENVHVRKPVTLLGEGAESTIVRASNTCLPILIVSGEGSIDVDLRNLTSIDVDVRNLTLVGQEESFVDLDTYWEQCADYFWGGEHYSYWLDPLLDAEAIAVAAEANVELSNVHLTDMAILAMKVADLAHVTVSSSTFSRCDTVLAVVNSARVVIDESSLSECNCLISGHEDSETVLRDVVISEFGSSTLYGSARLLMTNVQIRGAVDPVYGPPGIEARDSAHLEIAGSEFMDCYVSGFGTSTVKVSDSRFSGEAHGGALVGAGQSAHLEVTNCVIEDSSEAGIALCNLAKGTVSNTTIAGSAGAGVEVYDAAELSISDSLITRNATAGVLLAGANPTIRAVYPAFEDVVDVLGYLQAWSEVPEIRSIVEEISVEGCRAVLEDCQVVANLGFGIAAAPDSRGNAVEIVRCAVSKNSSTGVHLRGVPPQEKGLEALSKDVSATIIDSTINGNGTGGDCPSDGHCCGVFLGSGELELRNTVIANNAGWGVYYAYAKRLQMAGNTIFGNAHGSVDGIYLLD